MMVWWSEIAGWWWACVVAKLLIDCICQARCVAVFVAPSYDISWHLQIERWWYLLLMMGMCGCKVARWLYLSSQKRISICCSFIWHFLTCTNREMVMLYADDGLMWLQSRSLILLPCNTILAQQIALLSLLYLYFDIQIQIQISRLILLPCYTILATRALDHTANVIALPESKQICI